MYDSATGTWKTILVGGLNKGGRAYYALDITDPVNPKALWEFTHNPGVCSGAGQYSDCHLGYTFGNPVITKLKDGRWVVVVTSGYNNTNTPAVTGDGEGYLYVLEAHDRPDPLQDRHGRRATAPRRAASRRSPRG